MKHEDAPPGFSSPTELPKEGKEAAEWQQMNRSWWEAHPMRYDWREKVGAAEFSPEFYVEIDRRFFADAFTYMPWKERPFEALIPYEVLSQKDVLEIGVGNGSHAQLLASTAGTFTGIDLTSYAVESTSKRMDAFNIPARIVQMDAERLEFDDASFDFVWSWGVIHHSSNTARILNEIHRVLRPGGTAVLMVYYRSWWNAYITCGLLHGIIRGEFWKGRSLHEIMQKATDGALARFYTIEEWRRLIGGDFEIKDIRIFGSKAEALPIPAGPVKSALLRWTPNSFTRLLVNTCKMGSYLVSTLVKNSGN